MPEYRTQMLEEKELEINQIRSEYMSLLTQKNAQISEKEGENSDLLQQIEDLNRTISRLESDEKVSPNYKIPHKVIFVFI